MIKFFRNIRQTLMMENKTGKSAAMPSAGKTAVRYLKYAIGEIVLVVIGILIALQINNWNEERKEAKQEQQILQKLQLELSNDINLIQLQIDFGKQFVNEIKFCLNVLGNKIQAKDEEFHKNFSAVLQFISFNINRTTYNGITESRTIDFIKNTQLVDSLNTFYNFEYKGWDEAIKDYTRNVIAPFLMNFDHIPGDYSKGENYSKIETSQFDIPKKTIKDYKKISLL